MRNSFPPCKIPKAASNKASGGSKLRDSACALTVEAESMTSIWVRADGRAPEVAHHSRRKRELFDHGRSQAQIGVVLLRPAPAEPGSPHSARAPSAENRAARKKGFRPRNVIRKRPHASPYLLRHVGRQAGANRRVQERVGKIFQLHALQAAGADVQRWSRLRIAHDLGASELHRIRDHGQAGGVGDLHLVVAEPQRIRRQGQFAGIRQKSRSRSSIEGRPDPGSPKASATSKARSPSGLSRSNIGLSSPRRGTA